MPHEISEKTQESRKGPNCPFRPAQGRGARRSQPADGEPPLHCLCSRSHRTIRGARICAYRMILTENLSFEPRNIEDASGRAPEFHSPHRRRRDLQTGSPERLTRIATPTSDKSLTHTQHG